MNIMILNRAFIILFFYFWKTAEFCRLIMYWPYPLFYNSTFKIWLTNKKFMNLEQDQWIAYERTNNHLPLNLKENVSDQLRLFI